MRATVGVVNVTAGAAPTASADHVPAILEQRPMCGANTSAGRRARGTRPLGFPAVARPLPPPHSPR